MWCVGVWVVCVLCVVCGLRVVRCVCCVFGLWSASFACWVLWSVFRVVSVVCGLVSRRHHPRRLSSRLCRLVAVSLCLCVLCVMRYSLHTPAWNNKIGLVAYFVCFFLDVFEDKL